MIGIGVQTKNAINDDNPEAGFKMLKRAGFSNADFSLNGYLLNTKLYKSELNTFFDKSVKELEDFFAPHKSGAKAAGITINQMHMPYPIYVPKADKAINDYLWKKVAPKSMNVCAFLECPYIVIHGFKLAYFLGSEELEWQETEKFIDSIAPYAKEMGITICIENLYDSIGGHLVEGPCCNAAKAVERIERINDKYNAEVLGFCFDTGHANLVGIDMEKFITTLGNHLKVLHIHDNDGISDLHQIPFTFTKTRENLPSTDWEGFINGLKRIGYSGALSFETAPVLNSFPEEMKYEALEFIAKIGRYFAKECESL
ncbi:MAG: sugar phosphate isomerase/epimerase [Clostridiales bacterium]|nr:sugar phosphate isomerase/epimerase [Clostridiales bacterium]